jgi:hemerythrin
MAIQWTDDLAVGILEIDNQHIELFERINVLFEACNQGKGRAEISTTIAFLEEYVDTHFGSEERNMVRALFPGRAAHLAQHAIFRKNVSDIKRQLEEEGPGIHIIILTNHMVIEWLKNHIRTLDKNFGAYMRNQVPQ